MLELAPYVALAERLAEVSQPIALSYFRGAFAIDTKDDASPVTVADRQCEQAMRALINETFPDHGILGEEFGNENVDAEFVWVLDPIDGTHSFVTGKPLFGTLIALTRHGVPVLGVINMPALNERWVGVSGRKTTFNGRDVTSRALTNLADAWLYATTPDMFAGPDAAAFRALSAGCRRTGYGADCYAYGLLANGTVDVVCEAMLQPYDYCALVPVIDGAGGRVTDWSGSPLTIASDGRVLAAGDARIHEIGLSVLAAHAAHKKNKVAF
ncbi:histidinol-phosphatase [Varunaivibrio sulfuroxidans]|uniref:Histidinol-phosphatase n=1 Tax=Varunaivibrio sulfuroxidans TaxID=1773489 RepID=A0A4R3JHP7_9PROT|nr:histidinol-phosphatase [Varunaivibrio sulfuroxidans]TCS65035.1 inositol-phosphate phosphatase/L-galactose 1-phosphate phosphatase/histidinol-phosphatase [Varunaivibrio sulfuroxidans]WES29676.1 histidinol-phosphatase [Varunaivibrio sulfuroxidans]